MTEETSAFQTKYARGVLIACVVGLVTVGISIRNLSLATGGRLLLFGPLSDEHRATNSLLSSTSSKHQTVMLKRVMEMNLKAAAKGDLKTNADVEEAAAGPKQVAASP